jgi:hypothetical protein
VTAQRQHADHRERRHADDSERAGDPMTIPVPVSTVEPTARAMPKSITRGPSGANSTLDGFKSRCTIPAA